MPALCALAITEPNTEPAGMTDYQLDQVEAPRHHPATVARFTGSPVRVHRLFAKHYGVKAPTRCRLILPRCLVRRPMRVNRSGCFCAQALRGPKYSRVGD
jgi:hypothetical protein